MLSNLLSVFPLPDLFSGTPNFFQIFFDFSVSTGRGSLPAPFIRGVGSEGNARTLHFLQYRDRMHALCRFIEPNAPAWAGRNGRVLRGLAKEEWPVDDGGC